MRALRTSTSAYWAPSECGHAVWRWHAPSERQLRLFFRPLKVMSKMQIQRQETPHGNTALARKCLELIRDIAGLGASSWDQETVGYALQELSQVLLERTGSEAVIFLPVPAQ